MNQPIEQPSYNEEETVQTDENGKKFIILKPNWPNVTRDFARRLAMHGFIEGSHGPVISFIEMVRYLQMTDPEELEKIRVELLSKPQ